MSKRPQPQDTALPEACDVIVVGAGFSGLTAARELQRHGLAVRLLEAQDRVGGRIKPGLIAGLTIDLGGMWMGPTQSQLIAMAQEFGMQTYAQPLQGLGIIDVCGQVSKAEGEDYGSVRAPSAHAQMQQLVAEVESLAHRMPADEHWTWDEAADLDSLTLAHWLALRGAEPEVRQAFSICCRSLLCAEAHEVSLLHFVFYIKSGGGFTSLTTATDGAQKWLIDGSLHQVASRLAESLSAGTLRLSTCVDRIQQHEGSISVFAAGEEYRARAAIVALPPTLAGRLTYVPPLRPLRDGLTQRVAMGSVIKVYMAYSEPFWRQDGLNGLVLSDSKTFSPIFDVSPPGQTVGILCGFIDGTKAIEASARGAEWRRQQFQAELVHWFGERASAPIDHIEQDWTVEPFSRGCYGGYFGPGAWTRYGDALRRPEGSIFWAGTETASRWYCYVDGAISAGLRAAAEVRDHLGSQHGY